ncbi:MAG: hypothetical protein QX197_12635 [Methylococcaceae bacterium]
MIQLNKSNIYAKVIIIISINEMAKKRLKVSWRERQRNRQKNTAGAFFCRLNDKIQSVTIPNAAFSTSRWIDSDSFNNAMHVDSAKQRIRNDKKTKR